MVANIIDEIPENLSNTDYLTQIQVIFDNEETNGAEVVSQYDFDEGENQFTTYPYVFTGINYVIKYAFAKNCADPVVLNPTPCP